MFRKYHFGCHKYLIVRLIKYILKRKIGFKHVRRRQYHRQNIKITEPKAI